MQQRVRPANGNQGTDAVRCYYCVAVGPSWLVDHDQKGVRDENNFGKQELITVFDKNKSVVITSWTTLDIALIIIIIH